MQLILSAEANPLLLPTLPETEAAGGAGKETFMVAANMLIMTLDIGIGDAIELEDIAPVLGGGIDAAIASSGAADGAEKAAGKFHAPAD